MSVDWRSATWLGARLVQQPVLLLSVAMFLVVLPLRPEVASLANVEVLLLSMTLLVVLSIGQGFAMITGGIDLSYPGLMSLASVIGASIMAEASPLAGTGAGAAVAVLAMLLVGVVVGALQGTAIALLRMPALLVTLASLMMLGGLAVWVTHSQRIAVPEEFIQIWYGRWLGVPRPVVAVLGLAVLAHVVLAHTVFGRRLYAVGHSLPSSRVSGVPVARILVGAYVASGLCAGIASVLYTSRLYTGSPQLVQNEILMDCIGAAVIGGTSLFGGRGSIAGIVLGALFLSLVGNSLNLLGLRYWHVIMVKGGVILLAALLDSIQARRSMG